MAIGKRSQKREETRQEILSAAAKLFSEKGYAESSVEDIAAAAEVVKGTFYYNFSSKEDVVLALRHQSVQQAINEVEELSAKGVSPLKCIEHYLVAISRWSEENPELASVLFSNGPLFLTFALGPGRQGRCSSSWLRRSPPLPIVLQKFSLQSPGPGRITPGSGARLCRCFDCLYQHALAHDMGGRRHARKPGTPCGKQLTGCSRRPGRLILRAKLSAP